MNGVGTRAIVSSFLERHSDAAAPDDRTQVDALRFWLASGLHKFAVDPRRRLGGHRRVRELLTQGRPTSPASSGAWQALAATLDRHTVLGGMTELTPEERRVILLAYLEGRTNGEIAASLEVSVGTVRRRLKAGLKQIDIYLTRTGTWVLAILLLGAGYVVGAAARLGRSAINVRSVDWTYTFASTAVVGAVAVTALGSTSIAPASFGHRRASPPIAVQAIAAPSSVGAKLSPGPRPGIAPVPNGPIVVAADRSHGQGQNDNAIDNQTTDFDHPNNGKGQHDLAPGQSKKRSGQPPDQGDPPGQDTQES